MFFDFEFYGGLHHREREIRKSAETLSANFYQQFIINLAKMTILTRFLNSVFKNMYYRNMAVLFLYDDLNCHEKGFEKTSKEDNKL